MLQQVHVYIKGDVVGVGFRAWTKIQAKPLTIHGWIRNVFEKPDVFGPGGGVEAVLQGEQEQLEKIVEMIRRGPPVSRVDEVEVFFQEPKELFTVFEIRK